MPKDHHKLAALVAEYGQMRRLVGMNEQRRGQRLNGFLAELLVNWGVPAESSINGEGEIDVAFEFKGRHFVLEAKWEKGAINTDPIAKLQKRLRQRLGGTLGIFLSMSGYTTDALHDLKIGEQLQVLLLTKEHLEGIISGFITPQELLDCILRKASYTGDSLVPIELLFEPQKPESLGIVFGTNVEVKEISQLVTHLRGTLSAGIVASKIPFGQTGILELNRDKIRISSIRRGRPG